MATNKQATAYAKRIKDLEARLAKVVALHSKRTSADSCKVCLELAPCPTLLAAKG